MQRVAALAITSQTGALPFSPLVDGVTIPADPALMLRRGEVSPGVGFLAGAQVCTAPPAATLPLRHLSASPLCTTSLHRLRPHLSAPPLCSAHTSTPLPWTDQRLQQRAPPSVHGQGRRAQATLGPWLGLALTLTLNPNPNPNSNQADVGPRLPTGRAG